MTTHDDRLNDDIARRHRDELAADDEPRMSRRVYQPFVSGTCQMANEQGTLLWHLECRMPGCECRCHRDPEYLLGLR